MEAEELSRQVTVARIWTKIAKVCARADATEKVA